MLDQTETPRGSGIGAGVEEIRTRLMMACDALAAAGDVALAERIAPIRYRLAGYMARVAIVGQMKAGKSTLTNSLTRRAQLLPSDINPWTSVVTRLYFGHPSGQTDGARFRFFDEAHWERLANHGGKLGELTEGLLDARKRDQLFDQVSAMRKRAQHRLGDTYDTLLGKSHRYDRVTPKVIERYVCAGDAPGEATRNPTAGQYNDITHTAEIYFKRYPFACSTCLMDTPGTNDPLLIREEITQQSLETAEYFIVVLSAHQALSESDLRLIRILKALKRDRIVAFVNRIDEVNELATDFEDLRNRVKTRLRQELGAEVPVIMGSASWANLAMTGGESEQDRELISNVSTLKAQHPDALVPMPDLGEGFQADARLASGLGELEMALSRLIFEGARSMLFTGVMQDLMALTRQAADQASFRLKEANAAEAAASGRILESDRERLLAETRSRVETMLTKVASRSELEWKQIHKKMSEAVNQFVVDQETVLLNEVRAGARARSISLNVDGLRETLKSVFASGFGKVQDVAWTGLRSLNTTRPPSGDGEAGDRVAAVRVATLGVLSVEPRNDLLYRSVTLDFATNWLASLFARADSRVRMAIESVRGQFEEIGMELIAIGKRDLDAQIKLAVDNYFDDLGRLLDVLTVSSDTVEPKKGAVSDASEQFALAQDTRDKLLSLRGEFGLVPRTGEE